MYFSCHVAVIEGFIWGIFSATMTKWNKISILFFEIANTIVKGANLMHFLKLICMILIQSIYRSCVLQLQMKDLGNKGWSWRVVLVLINADNLYQPLVTCVTTYIIEGLILSQWYMHDIVDVYFRWSNI
ncbi:unnamed protein product [Brassica rapa subsp. narinosa]